MNKENQVDQNEFNKLAGNVESFCHADMIVSFSSSSMTSEYLLEFERGKESFFRIKHQSTFIRLKIENFSSNLELYLNSADNNYNQFVKI